MIDVGVAVVAAVVVLVFSLFLLSLLLLFVFIRVLDSVLLVDAVGFVVVTLALHFVATPVGFGLLLQC